MNAVTEVYLSQDKGATVYAGALDVTGSAGVILYRMTRQ